MDTWPIEEAALESATALEIFAEDGLDYYHQWVIRTRQHWAKVFEDDADYKAFSDHFNALTFETTGVAF